MSKSRSFICKAENKNVFKLKTYAENPVLFDCVTLPPNGEAPSETFPLKAETLPPNKIEPPSNGEAPPGTFPLKAEAPPANEVGSPPNGELVVSRKEFVVIAGKVFFSFVASGEIIEDLKV